MTDEGDPAPAGEPYFAEHPRSRPAPRELKFLFRGELLSFVLDRGIFSARGLDPGTALLIQNLGLRPTDRVLDLGCGWGAVGVAAAKTARDGRVVLTEVNRRAARLAQQNLARNRVRNAEVRVGPFFDPVRGESFDVIATNPPYRVGRPHILRLLTEAPEHLAPGGRLLLVGKGSQGIRYYQEWLDAHGPGPVRVLDRGSGYRVLETQRAAAPSVRDGPPPTAAAGGARSA
jgi:16S rRNA (guanine1207-N2)-methyltransferase